MPVVDLWRAEDHAQRADRKAHIRVDVDRPDATEGDEADQRFDREAEHDCGKIDQADGVDRIERMLAMRRQPVEMLRAVMHRMEPPEEADIVLQTMPPVDEEVAQQ